MATTTKRNAAKVMAEQDAATRADDRLRLMDWVSRTITNLDRCADKADDQAEADRLRFDARSLRRSLLRIAEGKAV